MKLLATVTATLILAGVAMAAPTPSMPVPLPQAGASCPTPAPAIDSKKFTWKHGNDEYKDYGAFAPPAQVQPAQGAQMADAFIQKYPDSDYKLFVTAFKLNYQFHAKQYPPALQTAQVLLKMPGVDAPTLLAVYQITAYILMEPGQLPEGDAAKLGLLKMVSDCGLQAGGNADATYLFTKAKGFADLESGDANGAIDTLGKAVAMPAGQKDAVVFYWMGDAYFRSIPPNDTNYDQVTEIQRKGMFYIARASVLAPNAQAIKDYLNQVYNKFHGGPDGLDALVAAAQNSSTLPPNLAQLTVTKHDMDQAAADKQYQEQLIAAKNAPPPPDSFSGIIWRMSRLSQFPNEWADVQGMKGLDLNGTVTASTASTVDVCVPDTKNPESKATNLHVVLRDPLPVEKRPKPGSTVEVLGAIDSYKLNPFVLTLKDGEIPGVSPKSGGEL